MGFVILRTQKLKHRSEIRRSLKHAFREQDTPNADPDRLDDNTHAGAQSSDEAMEKLDTILPDKVRKNAVLAIEYLISGTPESLEAMGRDNQDAYFDDALQWLKDKHGEENLVYAGIHRDESNPHMYAYVVPIDHHGNLNCRDFLGGADKLTEMQTEFAKKVGAKHGLERGIEGSKAKHTTIKEFYSKLNKSIVPLPEIKTKKPKELPPEPSFWQFAEKSAWNELKKAHDEQQAKHVAEVKARRLAAEKQATNYEAQAFKAQVLQEKQEDIKKTAAHYFKKAADAVAIASLFRPEEIEQAQKRKQAEDQRAEREAMEKAEAAREAKLAAEAKALTELSKELRERPVEPVKEVANVRSIKRSNDNDRYVSPSP